MFADCVVVVGMLVMRLGHTFLIAFLHGDASIPGIFKGLDRHVLSQDGDL